MPDTLEHFVSLDVLLNMHRHLIVTYKSHKSMGTKSQKRDLDQDPCANGFLLMQKYDFYLILQKIQRKAIEIARHYEIIKAKTDFVLRMNSSASGIMSSTIALSQ